MGETAEKIYCCDRDNNDNALAAAILANGNNRRDDWGPMAAMMGGGMNNWMNNPFAYLMFLALFRNGGFGFGGDGAGGDGAGAATQGIETQAQRQIADFCGDLFLQNCKDTAELRNGQRDLGFAITQGFSSTAFQAQQDKCDILRAGQDNTQHIIDTLNNHWKDEQALKIQDLKFELSQERQNNLINERFNRLGNCGCGGNSCGCGCGQ